VDICGVKAMVFILLQGIEKVDQSIVTQVMSEYHKKVVALNLQQYRYGRKNQKDRS
jgi:hypothetical protein